MLTAVLDGGARVAGFDIVFANSIEQSELPFGDDAVGTKLRGFDRPFLRALATGAAAGKVVLSAKSDYAVEAATYPVLVLPRSTSLAFAGASPAPAV